VKSGRLKVGDSVRHIDGREGCVVGECDTGFKVMWVNGMPQVKPIKEGFLERIRDGLTSFTGAE